MSVGQFRQSDKSSRRTAGAERGCLCRVQHRDSSRSSQSSDEDLPGPDPSVRGGFERAEKYYGREFDSVSEITRVRQLEASCGSDVHEWIEEGLPVGAMGKPSKMEAYRERKGTPIPWDIEDQNQDSEDRNTADINRKVRQLPAGRTDVSYSVRDVISSPGQSLDEPIQRAMEERMGDSFDDVQIHAGPKAAETAEKLNARAFTVGNHIAFNHGEYDPESAEGQHVLAHELAHVRQQTGGALSMLPQEDVALEIDPDPELEREAEETAERVMAGGKLDIRRMQYTDIHVQRYAEHDRVQKAREETRDAQTTIDPDNLVEEVAQLRKDVDELQSPDRADRKVAKEAGKGTLATVGGAAGSVIGNVIAPGVGGATGKAIGETAGGAIGGAMGAVYERNFDDAADAVNEKFDGIKSYIDSVIREEIRSLVGEGETGSGLEGVGERGNVRE